MAIPTDQEIADAARQARYDALTKPVRVQSGTRVIENRTADEIEKLSSGNPVAAAQPHFGIRMTQLTPGGCG